GETVTFNASASQPGFDGTNICPIAWYYWDFGDGNILNTSDPIVTHIFSSEGIYYVNLTIYAPPSPEAHPSYYPYGATVMQVTVESKKYTLTIIAEDGGTTDPPPGSYTYDEGTIVSVTAIPDENYVLDHWELDGVFYSDELTVEVTMDSDHELRAFFKYLPPLSVSISPSSVTIKLGESVTFTSSVSGGFAPYSYQWYVNNEPVSGATSDTWTFTPSAAGIYYVYVVVTDSENQTAQSPASKVVVQEMPTVGGAVYPVTFTLEPENSLRFPVAFTLILVGIALSAFAGTRKLKKSK
ncbi:hypothetical protein DRO54_10585, partial [Candidatus Bathyarchaeota archaeon]